MATVEEMGQPVDFRPLNSSAVWWMSRKAVKTTTRSRSMRRRLLANLNVELLSVKSKVCNTKKFLYVRFFTRFHLCTGMRVCIDYNKPNTTNPNREYRVIGVDKSALDITFPDREGQMTNVAEYFKKTYTALRFPRMPTLKVGSKQKPIHLPIEVRIFGNLQFVYYSIIDTIQHCYLAKNQRVPKKLTENQTSQMIRVGIYNFLVYFYSPHDIYF